MKNASGTLNSVFATMKSASSTLNSGFAINKSYSSRQSSCLRRFPPHQTGQSSRVSGENTPASNGMASRTSALTVAEQGRIAGSDLESGDQHEPLRGEYVGLLESDGDETLRGDYASENKDMGTLDSNEVETLRGEDNTEGESVGLLESDRDITLGSQDTVKTDDDEMQSNDSAHGGEEGSLRSEGDVTLGKHQMANELEIEEDELASESDSAAEDNRYEF
ncbi:hypothetical protein PTTG_09117 [Puccinia triticina 1-1 BBBD Race 1]|uniref:Uncharacterized protein n=1 Tax=Puccinia triticina (isolate 1-1 / race 1 (BBBD)) TaxID=630390 RepID=A0A180FZT9_PUCT1|nr:hypothetical protein PTTG_09117 [Puccinia triticina 1-1 BBBD Race 1]